MEIDYRDVNTQIENNKRLIATKKSELIIGTSSLEKTETLVDNSKYIKKQEKEEISIDATIPTLDGFKSDIRTADRISGINSGIGVLDTAVNNTLSAVDSAINYGNNLVGGIFGGGGPSQSEIDNYAINERKQDAKKSVDLTAINIIPYAADKLLKQFQSGDLINSVISGTVGILGDLAKLEGGFYDFDELAQIASASYTQINNNGNLSSGSGLFGFNIAVGGGKPGIKIKKKSKDGKFFETMKFKTPDDEESPWSRANIGYLYVRPFQNNLSITPFKIPFQMNVKISEDSITANYSSEQFLNRVGEIQSFIGTGSLRLSLETEYTILSEGTLSAGFKSSFGLDGNNVRYSSWMEDWTPSFIQSIENAYRSLVFSTYYEDGSVSVGGLLKPPTVRIVMSSNGTASLGNGLYSYPQGRWSLKSGDTSINNDFSTTLSKLDNDKTIKNEYKWNKAFIVTSVQISVDENTGINYSSNSNYKYTGFKVNMSLLEVTENYLDCIPDFISYYKAFVGELQSKDEDHLKEELAAYDKMIKEKEEIYKEEEEKAKALYEDVKDKLKDIKFPLPKF